MTLMHHRQIWEAWVKIETYVVEMKSNSLSSDERGSGRE
jgi:hypothetical protein